MKAVVRGASLQLHYGGAYGRAAGGGRRDGARSERAFARLTRYFQQPCGTLIVKASSKRNSSRRKTQKSQERSKSALSSIGKEIKGNEHMEARELRYEGPDSPAEIVEKEREAVFDELNSINPLSSKRAAVLKACVTTSAVIFVAGLLLQQASHFAADSGWSVQDCTILLKFDVESWHLATICGLLLVVSSCRQILLLFWPEFLESSDRADEEVLGPLQPADYLIVAIMPGLSEELLFRGALLPLCGLDWKGASVTGLLFGVLHLTGGRKKAFAIWASFVGVLYGLSCVATGNVLVPMVAHSINNLIGATIWKWKQTSRSSLN